MSRPPYNFADERPQSPFDRPQQQGSSGPPPSFKTNVNRNKTRKWAEAKQHNYDGDEWGGFDPYDEYGNYDEPAGAPQPARMRQHSFDKGEERRAFSAGTGPPGQYQRGYPPSQQPYGNRPRTASQDASGLGPRRDFSQPAYAPPPLKAAQSPGGRGPPGSAPPPRKSSLSQAEPPFMDEGGKDEGGKPAAAIPFIRPSDIYKRMQQEKERQSLDSSRPSIDSGSSRKTGAEQATPEVINERASAASPPTGAMPGASNQTPSATGAELSQPASGTSAVSTAQSGSAPDESPLDMPKSSIDGFQSIVDHAFDRQDDNSVPPTPISTNASSSTQLDLSRSNTDSTSGVSPIMSRVPSSAAEESRGRAAAMNRERAMSEITEEAPLQPPPKAGPRQGTPTRPTHSRPGSVESFIPGHTRKVSTPSPHASPARSPRIQTTDRRLSQPLAAEVAQEEIVEPASATSEYSKSTYPTSATSDRSTATFPAAAGLAGPKSPTSEMPVRTVSGSRSGTPLQSPVDGRRSPFTGGRVRDLAGKYNEIDSRRNSQVSLKSKGSFSSWGRSDDAGSKLSRTGSGQASPEPSTSPPPASGDQLQRPRFDPQPSFRPHLPGEWVSTTDFRQDLKQAPENINEAKPEGLQAPAEEKDLPKTPTSASRSADIDLTPKAVSVDRSSSTRTTGGGPVDALKAAGAALGASLTASTESSHSARDFASPSPAPAAAPADDQPKRSIGDVYMRPLEFQRTASSIASTDVVTPSEAATPSDAPETRDAPTPPAKDTPSFEAPGASGSYFGTSRPERDSWEGSRTSDDIDDEQDTTESDLLRREIVRSLTPQAQDRITDERTREQDALDAPDNLREVQHAEGIQPSHPSPLRTAESASALPAVAELDGTPQQSDAGPGLLNKRFSWESKPSTGFNPGALDSEVDLPQMDLRVINPASPPAPEPRTASPIETTHNRNMSDSSLAPAIGVDGRSPVSLVIVSDVGKIATTEQPPSPVSEDLRELPAERTSADAGLTKGPEPITTAPIPEPAEKSQKIPSFREIAGIKSSSERIDKYNTTRQQFADMNTGLQGWLSTTIAANPDLSYLTNTNANILPGGPPTGSVRHRQTPSIIKMAKGFGNKGDGPSSPSTDSQAGQPSRRTSNNFSSHSPQASVNAEKMQAMGKDFLSSAGKLGGKGISGAKGWLAKGKQKLRDSSGGADKAPSAEISRSVTPMSSAAPTADNTRSSSPAPDAQATSSIRPRHSKRNSSSWSANRLSFSLERFRSDKSEKSRSRSRPQSLIIPSRSSTPMLDMNELDRLQLDEKLVEESPHPDKSATRSSTNPASSTWTSNWDQHDFVSPITSPFKEPGFRLGVLPSPGNETFTSSLPGSRDGSTVNVSPVRARALNSDPLSRSRRDTVDSHVLSPIMQRSPEDNVFQSSQLPESLNQNPDPNTSKAEEEPGRPSPIGDPAEPASAKLPHVVGSNSSREQSAGLPHETEPVELPANNEMKPGKQPSQRDQSTQESQPVGERSTQYEEKKDTPMIASPEFRLNDQKPNFGSEDERNEWEGVKARISRSQLSSANESKRSSGMALSIGLNSVPSDISLVSAGTVEKPSQVEMVRVGSPKLVNNRSSLPSQSRQSSYSQSRQPSYTRSPAATPHKEIEYLRLQKRNTDSPTVPEHLTPRSTTFPPEMYDSDTTPFTTPGEEDRRIDETAIQTPRATHSPGETQVSELPGEQQLGAQRGVGEMPLVVPEQKRFGIVAQDSQEVEAQGSSGAGYPDYDPRRGRMSMQQVPSNPNSFPPSRDFTPPPHAEEPYEYRRAPPKRLSGAESRRWSQYQSQLDHETQFGQDFYAPPQYQGLSAAPNVADQHDSYHRDYMDDRLVEMSPLEASMFNREDAFRQATERQQAQQQLEENTHRKHSRTPSLGPSLVGEPPKSSHQPMAERPTSFKRSSSRLLGAFDRPASGTHSTLASNRMSNMTSTMDLDTLDNPSKGKLKKKDRRASVQRATSTATPPPPPAEKKKRFSGLGSLFGRSKSNAVEPSASSSAAASKRNRLSKQGPMIISAPRQISPDKLAPQEEYGSGPASEQATLADDNLHPRSMTPLSRRSSGMMHSSPSRSNTMASKNGWYGPSEEQAYAQPTLPNVAMSTRRLHSERPSKRFSYVDVPEEFQPVDASFRPGVSPNDQPRLSQVYEQTIPPMAMPSQRVQPGMVRGPSHEGAGRGHPSNRFASNPAMPPERLRSPSGSSNGYNMPAENSRRTASPMSGYNGSPSPQNVQRMKSLGSVITNSAPTGYRDNGGYYIPQQDNPRPYPPYRQSSGEYYQNAQGGAPNDLQYYHASPQHSRQTSGYSGYHTPEGQDSGSMHSGYNSRRGSQAHQRHPSREAAMPYSFMTVSAGAEGRSSRVISPVPSMGQPAFDSSQSPSQERQSRRLSAQGMNAGSSIRHHSPSKRQAEEHNDYVMHEYERQQQQYRHQQPQNYQPQPHQQSYHARNQASNGSRDSELYQRSEGRQAPPQPGRLVTDFSGETALPGQQGGRRSHEEGQMKGSSYPGQEWTPSGVEDGRYTWE
ncbi:FAM50 family protein [Elsinoe australis]|uniref:FAM50 family protein n=1 Tax=Elsinoe australis TaxID=40998 RepID=A0A2P7YFV4_9PEZI|nr:FAM50 family protein [Elsinoe australis]